MANATRNTIVVSWPVETGPKILEDIAGEAGILPGHLIEAGATDLLLANATVNTGTNKLVAVENPFQEPASGVQQIETAYADNDIVRFVAPLPGAVLNMLIADGETTAVGSPMMSTGDGTLTVGTPATTDEDESVVGYATEIVAASGAAARTLIRMA